MPVPVCLCLNLAYVLWLTQFHSTVNCENMKSSSIFSLIRFQLNAKYNVAVTKASSRAEELGFLSSRLFCGVKRCVNK